MKDDWERIREFFEEGAQWSDRIADPGGIDECIAVLYSCTKSYYRRDRLHGNGNLKLASWKNGEKENMTATQDSNKDAVQDIASCKRRLAGAAGPRSVTDDDMQSASEAPDIYPDAKTTFPFSFRSQSAGCP